jgi:hypothetical protein
MPRGGPRPNSGGFRHGAGRPKSVDPASEPRRVAVKGGLTPLDYMLAVMNDAEADPLRRDRMAVAAAPYVHVKPQPEAPALGKKEARRQAAETAGQNSEWGDDLAYQPAAH